MIVRPADGEKPMSIYEQVLTFIHRPEPESFRQLALDVFRHQFETVGAYRRYCKGRRVEPDSVPSVDDVPAVSNVAFKYSHPAIYGPPPPTAAAVFLSLPTTPG